MGSVGIFIASSSASSSSLSSGVTGMLCTARDAASSIVSRPYSPPPRMRLMLHRALSVRRSANRSGSASARSIISVSVMASFPGVAYHTGAALFRPACQDVSAALDHSCNFHVVTGAGTEPGVIPILMSRRLIRFTCDVQHGSDDLLIVPVGRKLGLAGFANSMPVAAPTAVSVAVEYVHATFRADAQSVQRRPIACVYRIPAGM